MAGEQLTQALRQHLPHPDSLDPEVEIALSHELYSALYAAVSASPQVLDEGTIEAKFYKLVNELDHRGRHYEEGILSMRVGVEEYNLLRSAAMRALKGKGRA